MNNPEQMQILKRRQYLSQASESIFGLLLVSYLIEVPAVAQLQHNYRLLIGEKKEVVCFEDGTVPKTAEDCKLGMKKPAHFRVGSGRYFDGNFAPFGVLGRIDNSASARSDTNCPFQM